MTDSDVQLLLVDLALIIVLARLLGALARRIGQPPVLGEIVAGILLGPTIWGTTITGKLFPPGLIPPLTALADLGLVFFMFVVRPGLRRLAGVYERQGRLTPSLLAAVLALLLLSSYATDWMGVKFIFGAFIFGVVMPRDIPALREAILDRLEQVSVLVLLPVFFVVAGLNVNLRGIGLAGLLDLVLIMLVAVAGKFGGAYLGARITGVRRRQAGALAALLNTRGLTELVILTVGLQLGILNKPLYALMVAMAI